MGKEEFKRDLAGFLVRDSEGRPIRLTPEEQEAQVWEQAQDSNGNWYYTRYHEDRDRRRKTVKINDPDRPGQFMIINERDFNPSQHRLWVEE